MKLFLSFNKHDLEIARWIGWNAERSGCDVVFQEWDFAPGTNFVQQMRTHLGACDKLIAVISPNYLEALFTHPEWQHFFQLDPTGAQGLILPIRVAECDLGPLLNTRIHIDFVGQAERECRRRLLAALKGERRKPKRPPPFPLAPSFPIASPATRPATRPAGTDWLTELLSASSALEALANVYHRADPQRADMVALTADHLAWAQHQKLRAQVTAKLKVDDRLTLLHADKTIDLLRTAREVQALAALLPALARLCLDRIRRLGPSPIQTSPHLGTIAYQISLDETPFAGNLPRHTEELSACLESLYLPDLRLVPATANGVALSPINLSHSTKHRLLAFRKAKTIRFALSSLGGNAELLGEALPGFPANEPSRFRLTGLNNPDTELNNLEKILFSATEAEAAVLLLPELRVTPTLLGAIQEYLSKGKHSLALVVAGSWHQPVETGFVNRATILGARGELLWTHDKLREYRAIAANVANAPAFFAALGIGPNGGFEGIQLGQTLQYCDTPIGRLCVAICVGFFHPDLQPILAETRSDFFLVPAMTSRVEDLQLCAEALVRQSAATLVANCGVVGKTRPPSGGNLSSERSLNPPKNPSLASTLP